MFSRNRYAPAPDGVHRALGVGVGVVVAVGASLSLGVAADAFAAPTHEQDATPSGVGSGHDAMMSVDDDVVTPALAEITALHEALEQAEEDDLARIHRHQPAVQVVVTPAERAAVTVDRDEPDVEVAPEPEPAPAAEPEPEPEPAPEPQAEPESEPVETGTSGVPRSTWRALAGCESNGDWTIDTGNSFYGGLQFNLKSWDWAGGQRYAEYPHHATKDQQIAIAERLLEMHPGGWAAWPACSAALGLR